MTNVAKLQDYITYYFVKLAKSGFYVGHIHLYTKFLHKNKILLEFLVGKLIKYISEVLIETILFSYKADGFEGETFKP